MKLRKNRTFQKEKASVDGEMCLPPLLCRKRKSNSTDVEEREREKIFKNLEKGCFGCSVLQT